MFSLLYLIGISTENEITGNVVNTNSVQELWEQVLTDENEKLEEGMRYSSGFEIYEGGATVSIKINSDNVVNYVLIPDYELDHYKRDESYKSFANDEDILSMVQDYNLDKGKYWVVLSNLGEETATIHLTIKAKNLW